MTAHIEWLHTDRLDITGSAQPGSFEGDEEANDVAAIRITSQFDGDGVIIQGRPERLVEVARSILRTAELVVEQTMRDPELRKLYGITDTTDDPPKDSFICMEAGQHVRFTRHTRWVCPHVTMVDVDG